LDDAEIEANRNGKSSDAKAEAALRFAAQVVLARGHVSDAEVLAVKAAGYSSAEIVEIVQHVALNTWTNYINEVAQTEIDFPAVRPSARFVS
jgi:alkylhydroperoxidase family enzyme